MFCTVGIEPTHARTKDQVPVRGALHRVRFYIRRVLVSYRLLNYTHCCSAAFGYYDCPITLEHFPRKIIKIRMGQNESPRKTFSLEAR